jgi:HK97 family phage portal protein
MIPLLENLLGRKKATEEKSAGMTPQQIEDLFMTLRSGGGSASGEYVSPSNAMKCTAVYACIGVISESVGQLPLKLYRKRADGGRDELREHPLFQLLYYQPNPWMNSMEFREMGTQHLCLRGDFFAFKNTAQGVTRELLPLHPDMVTVRQKEDWSLEYQVNFGTRGGLMTVPASSMLHVRYRTLDGVNGINPIAYNRETIGLAMAAEKHGARVFKNNARPGGVLETEKQLSKEAMEKLREQWQSMYSGEGQHKTAILEDGMKFSTMTMTNEDAQYLETRRFQVEDICRIFRVPLHEIQANEKTTSWGTGIEQMNIGFIERTLMPWLRRWELAIWKDLLSKQEQKTLYPEFVVDGFLRGDIKTRFESYVKGIQNGIYSPNEVRRKENMNPREGGDDYLTPLNHRTSGEESDAD